MGKGTRTRTYREELKRERLREKRRIEKRNKIIKRVSIGTGSVAVLAVVLVVVFNILTAAGFFIRHTISATSSTYKINNCMISYYFNSSYANFVDEYSDYLSSYGLDTSESLSSQSYSSSQTWYDYFMESTKSQVEQLVVLAEAAKVAGVTLDTEDNETISEYLTSIEEAAEKKDISTVEYIRSIYGSGVNEQDVKDCLELSALASKYYNMLNDGYTYTDDELETYAEENKADFLYCDYRSYTFTSTIPDGSTDEETAEINAATEVLANQLAACKTEDAFEANLTSYLESIGSTDTADSTLTEEYEYADSTDADVWLFADERIAGDTTVIAGTNEYTVYYVVKAPYRLEYTTKNVRHILLTEDTYSTSAKALAKANSLVDEWESGEKTADSFALLAEEYSEDTGSSSNGGLYENITKGEMVDEFEDWCYDTSRAVGDIGVIETDYGYHVMYFDGDGLVAWKSTAVTALKEADYDTQYAEYESLYPVTFTDTNLNKITEVTLDS